MEEFDKLFTEISNLKEKHKKEDLFNGFTAFGVNEKENMHSKFIAMLLNPKGDHKCGNKFLELFLSELEIDNFSLNGVKIELEKNANRRRIDIAIWNSTQFLIIENKVWASDQDNQLRDYYNFALEKVESEDHVFMIYLTPYGVMPTDKSFSLGELPEGYIELLKDKVKCISYEKHILQWLDACIDSINASDDIRLKISLEMYVELIRNVIKRDKYMNEIYNLLLENQFKLSTVIDIVNALQGRNFMTDKNFKSFIAQIQEAASKCGVDNPYTEPEYLPETMTYIEIVLENEDQSDIGSICFAKEEIYVKAGDSILSEFNIDTKIITDENLQNLLNQNSDGVYAWVEQIITKLRQV